MVKKKVSEFDSTITKRYGKEIQPTNKTTSYYEDWNSYVPEHQPYKDDADPEFYMPEANTTRDYDEYLEVEVIFSQEEGMKACTIMNLLKDKKGSIVGKAMII